MALLTDGATRSSDGVVAGFTDKVLILPSLPAMIAAQGASSFLWSLRAHWQIPPENFDAMLDALTWDTQLIEGAHRAHGIKPEGWRLIIAGYSHSRQAFEIYQMYGGIPEEACGPPYEAHRINDDAFALPPPSNEALQRSGLLATTSGEVRWLDRAKLLMQAMRETKMGYPGASEEEKFYGIGGFLQATSLSAAGFECRIVAEWPDEIGKPITPAGMPT